MKLNTIERLITGNPLRAFSQRHIEAPLLRRMGGARAYPLCLEIGCGRGVGAQAILERFGAQRVIATDVDPEQIGRARKNLKPGLRDRIELRVADAMSLGEPDEQFDAVFSFGVLHHTEDWRRAVKEVSRVLKTGGDFFFEEPSRRFLRNPLIRAFTDHPAGGEFDFDELIEELKKNSMEMVSAKRMGDTLIIGVARKLCIPVPHNTDRTESPERRRNDKKG